MSRVGATLARLGRGDRVGEMSVFDRQPRSADVVAEWPMTVLVISGREVMPCWRALPI